MGAVSNRYLSQSIYLCSFPPRLEGFQPEEHRRPGISRDHVGLCKAARVVGLRWKAEAALNLGRADETRRARSLDECRLVERYFWCNQKGPGPSFQLWRGWVSVGTSSSSGCAACPAGFVVAHALAQQGIRCLSSMQGRRTRKRPMQSTQLWTSI